MEYSLYTLNKKAKLNNLTSTELINTLNLIGFEVDGISTESLKTNKFIEDKKLLVKIPANREDLLNENLLLEDFSLLFLFQIYKIWESLKNDYSFLIQEKYKTSLNIKSEILNQENIDCIAYKIDFKLNKDIESPNWIKDKLANSGINSKTLLIDILNIVLLEFGSSFGLCFSKEEQNSMSIELLLEEESFNSITNTEIVLPKGSIVLKDKLKNINTVFSNISIFIENQSLVEKENKIDLKNLSNDIISLTFIFNNSFENKNLNLNNNFKKVLPFLRKSFSQNLQVSFQRLLTLLEIIGHAEITKVYKTDSKNFSIQNHKELKLSKNLLIKTLNLKDYDLNVFKKAGLKLVNENNEYLFFNIPSTRRDLDREIDLIEEYSRFVGYKNFVEILPLKTLIRNKKELKSYEFIQNFFLNYGFNEVFTNSIQEKKLQKNQIDITNPLNQEFHSLRTSILPEIIKIFELNLKLGASNLNFFEIGRVFKRVNNKIIEQDKLSGVFQFKFQSKNDQADYNWLVVKGFFEMFLSNFGYSDLIFEKLESNNLYFYPTRSIYIKSQNKILGTIGQINPKINELESSKLPIYLFDFNLNHLKDYRMKTEIKVAKDYSKYPSIFKDISFLINKSENFTHLKFDIEKTAKQIKKVSFFDVYFDNAFINNQINIVVRLEFQSVNETLTNEFIENEIQNIKNILKNIYKVEFRE
jgi:phenylalanyl-tRNA synthetase beta chain